MKLKKIISLVLAFMMITSVCASAKTLEFTLGETTAYESNGAIESFEIESAPYVNNSRTMVPVRVISEKFGANVEWVETVGQVIITKDGRTIILTLGSNEAIVDGETVVLDVVPEVINGRTMVPLRFISESLEMDVEYVSASEQIIITDDEPIMTVNGINIYPDDFWAAMVFVGYTPDQEDIIDECVNFVIDAFIEIYGSSAYLNTLNVYPPETYSDEVNDVIAPYKDTLTQTCLTAPIAQLMAADCFITDYVYTYCETEDALDMALEMYKKDYITAKHILLLCDDTNKTKVKKEAEKLLKRIKNGEDFDALMNELSEDPGLAQFPQGYTFTTGEMVPEFEEAAFALKEGEISGIVETDYGFHIIKREPLAEADIAMSDYLLEKLAMDVFNQIVFEASKTTDYTIHMPREEIVELFK